MRIYMSVFDIAKKFLNNNSPVKINEKGIEKTATIMLKTGKNKFPIKKNINHIYKSILQEFVGCSINYCYWYGLSNIRPVECSSTKMYNLVEKAFKDYTYEDGISYFIKSLIENLALERFPLLEFREKHLKELINEGVNFCTKVYNNQYDFNLIFTELIKTFPGYASDIFLKRASLFFLQLYRQYGWFNSAMNLLPVPADYQLPKILKELNCINYDFYLNEIIQNEILIPKGSREECCIRSATIIACKKLQEVTNWNISDIDGWLWLRRKEVNTPFHLCITTDY